MPNPVASEVLTATNPQAVLVPTAVEDMVAWVTSSADCLVMFSENGGPTYPVIANRPTEFHIPEGAALVGRRDTANANVRAVSWPDPIAQLRACVSELSRCIREAR